MEKQPADLAAQIFDSHFKGTLEPETYARARTIFEQVGAYNEHSLAIQIHTALQRGKLEAVLSSYEELLGAEDFQQLGFTERATYVRLFADHIYGEVIAEGEPMRLLDMRAQIETPKIFDLMSS